MSKFTCIQFSGINQSSFAQEGVEQHTGLDRFMGAGTLQVLIISSVFLKTQAVGF